MQLATTRFGLVEYDPDTVFTFTQPILGFQEFRRFLLLPGPAAHLRWLQSVDAGDLAFILMDPAAVVTGYSFELGAHELSELAVTRQEDLEVFTLVVIPADRARIRTNLKAPILISPKHRLAKQTVLERGEYPVQFFLAQAGAERPGSQEASNARSHA